MSKIISSLLIFICITSCHSSKESKQVSTSVIPVKGDSLYFFISPDGEPISKAHFSEISALREGLAVARVGKEKKYGFIDKNGDFTIPPVYEQATYFSEGLAWVVRDGQAPCAINKKGEMKFSIITANEVRPFAEGLAAFRSRNGLWGFVDNKGEIVINPSFIQTSSFSNGRAAIKNKKGVWTYINNTGAELFTTSYSAAMDFAASKRGIVKGNRKWGVISEKGDTIIPFSYDQIIADNELYLVKEQNKYFWIDQIGKKIFDQRFDNASLYNGSELAPVEIQKRWAYINKKGEVVIQRQFDTAYPFNGKHAIVTVGNRYGIINADGKYITNPMFTLVAKDYLQLSQSLLGEFSSVKTGK